MEQAQNNHSQHPPVHPHKAWLCPNTRVVSNLPLPPFNAPKQGLRPLPLTIWASHHPAYPAGFATPSTRTKHTRKRGFRV